MKQILLRCKKHLWAIIVLPLTLLVVFFSVLFGGKILLPTDLIDSITLPYSEAYHNTYDIKNQNVNDAALQFYPYKALTKKAWESGNLSCWNPKILCGYPQSSETFVSYFDVFNLVLLLGDMPGSYHWQILLQLLLAGIGMYAYLCVRKITPKTATPFAAAYMLNSMFISHLLYRWMVGSMCWLPLILLALYKLEEASDKSQQRKYSVWAIISLACGMVGGSAQSSVFLVFIVCAVILVEKIGSKMFWSALRRAFFIIIGAVALSAIMWFPVLELFIQVLFHGGSIHSTSVFSSYTLINRLWSFPLLGTFFMPQLAGGPISLYKLANAYTIDFTGSIGFIPLLAGLIGIVRYRKTKGLRVFSLLAVLGILLPIATPLYSFLYHRFFIVFFIATIVLGAHVVDSWFSRESSWDSLKKIFRFASIIYAIIVLALIAANIFISFNREYILSKLKIFAMANMGNAGPGGVFHDWLMKRSEDVLTHYSITEPTMYLPLAMIGISLLLLYQLKAPRKLSKTILIAGFVFTTVLQLGATARWWLPMTDPAIYPAYPRTEVTDYIVADTSSPRIFSPTHPPADQFVLVNNVNNMYGINDIRGFESLVPRSMATLQEKLKNPDTVNARLLGLFNTKYILTGKDTLIDPLLQKVKSGRVNIYYNTLIKPRTYMTYRWQSVHSDTEAIRIMNDPSFDGSLALLSQNDSLSLPQRDSGHFDIQVVSNTDNDLELQVQTDSPGLLILSDTYYPGWKSTVNGKSTDIHRINYCMRGVPVPAGLSKVRMSYEPLTATMGLWTTIATAGILFFVLFSWKKKALK